MSWFSIQELEYLLRIVLAAVCGGAIGFERERRSKSAGIRTHIIVALSAALMMVVSKYGFFDVIGLGGISLDASRVAAGVVTAIGFLGVGVIFTHGRTVSGVTTAAGLWATVGVGIAVGAGLYVTGGVATVLIVLFQVILHRSSPLVKTQRTGTVVLELSEAESDPAEVRRLLEERVSAVVIANHMKKCFLNWNKDGVRVTRLADGRAEVKCDVLFPAGYTAEDILRTLKGMPAIRSVEMHHPG